MATDAEFWVTVSTVAPVIGLAHAVVIGRFQPRLRSTVRRRTALLEDAIAALKAIIPEGQRLKAQTAELEAKAAADMSSAELQAEVQETLRRARSALDRREEADKKIQNATDLGDRWSSARNSARLADAASVGGFVICALALALGVFSLAWHTDLVPTVWGAVLLVVAMTLVMIEPAVAWLLGALDLDEDHSQAN